MMFDALQLLEENRLLRVELESLRAEKFAQRSERIRKSIDEKTLFVTEAELPDYVPYSRKDIRRLRRDGKIRGIKDLREGGKRWIYNLQDVKATVLAGRPSGAKKLLDFDMDQIRAAA